MVNIPLHKWGIRQSFVRWEYCQSFPNVLFNFFYCFFMFLYLFLPIPFKCLYFSKCPINNNSCCRGLAPKVFFSLLYQQQIGYISLQLSVSQIIVSIVGNGVAWYFKDNIINLMCFFHNITISKTFLNNIINKKIPNMILVCNVIKVLTQQGHYIFLSQKVDFFH